MVSILLQKKSFPGTPSRDLFSVHKVEVNDVKIQG